MCGEIGSLARAYHIVAQLLQARPEEIVQFRSLPTQDVQEHLWLDVLIILVLKLELHESLYGRVQAAVCKVLVERLVVLWLELEGP